MYVSTHSLSNNERGRVLGCVDVFSCGSVHCYCFLSHMIFSEMVLIVVVVVVIVVVVVVVVRAD